MRERSRGWVRRAFFPIAILVVAGLVTLQSRWEAPRRLEAAQLLARDVIAGGTEIGATDPALVRLARSAVGDARFTLEAREGDDGPGADGAATHVVMVVDGSPILGLRVRYDRDPARRAVIGVWRP
jgi:hypothetical protein